MREKKAESSHARYLPKESVRIIFIMQKNKIPNLDIWLRYTLNRRNVRTFGFDIWLRYMSKFTIVNYMFVFQIFVVETARGQRCSPLNKYV